MIAVPPRERGLIPWLPTLQEYEAHLEEENATTTTKMMMKMEARHSRAFALQKRLAEATVETPSMAAIDTRRRRRTSTRVSLQDRRKTKKGSVLPEHVAQLPPRDDTLDPMSCCLVHDEQHKGHGPPSLHDVAQKHTTCHMLDGIHARFSARVSSTALLSHELLAILESMEQDRWTCFCLKYAHFHIKRHRHHGGFALEMRKMRQLSERTRRMNIATAIAHAAPWYMVLCAKVLEYDALVSHNNATRLDASQRQHLPSYSSSSLSSSSHSTAQANPVSGVPPRLVWTNITTCESETLPRSRRVSPASTAARFMIDAIRTVR
jgi:hypothetical protein